MLAELEIDPAGEFADFSAFFSGVVVLPILIVKRRGTILGNKIGMKIYFLF